MLSRGTTASIVSVPSNSGRAADVVPHHALVARAQTDGSPRRPGHQSGWHAGGFAPSGARLCPTTIRGPAYGAGGGLLLQQGVDTKGLGMPAGNLCSWTEVVVSSCRLALASSVLVASMSLLASEMANACASHMDKDQAVGCYQALIAGMRENRAWCHGRGLSEATELVDQILKSRDQIQARWSAENARDVQEFSRQAEEHVAAMRAAVNPSVKAQIAAKWQHFEIEFRRNRTERKAARSLAQLYDEFGKLESLVRQLECP